MICLERVVWHVAHLAVSIFLSCVDLCIWFVERLCSSVSWVSFFKHLAHGNAAHLAVSIFLSRADHFTWFVSCYNIVAYGADVLIHVSVSIFLSRTVPPRPSQKVSKRNRHVCFGPCYACCISYSFMLLSNMCVFVVRGILCSDTRARVCVCVCSWLSVCV